MKYDIETLRAFIGAELVTGRHTNADDSLAALDRIIIDRDSLRKALDERWQADQKAAKAIFLATGRKCGFPSNKEVVAYYIAENERLQEECDKFLLAALDVQVNTPTKE